MKETDKIVVVLWFRNEYGHWYLNRNNHEIRGTLMNIIHRNHPMVEYHEVDMSEYNPNADTYDELAEELGIDLKMLYDAPIALVLHDESGDAFTTDKGSLALVKTVDKYIHKTEKEHFGKTGDLCNVEMEIREVSKFKIPSVLELEKQYKDKQSPQEIPKDDHKNDKNKARNQNKQKPGSSQKRGSKDTQSSTSKSSNSQKNESFGNSEQGRKPEPSLYPSAAQKSETVQQRPQVSASPSRTPSSESTKSKVAQALNPYAAEIAPVEYEPIHGKHYEMHFPSFDPTYANSVRFEPRSRMPIEYPPYQSTLRRPEDIYKERDHRHP
jgi:hypothetical protein